MRIVLNNVKRTVNDRTILHIDYLALDSGKRYAVLGPNGSGKTTLLKILSGIDTLWEGSISYDDIPELPRNDLAYMPQNCYLFDMTALQNVLSGIKGRRSEKKKYEGHAKSILQKVGLSGFENAKARTLSGGEAQKVALARTLILGKKCMLLDEPASATDIVGMETVEEFIRNTQQQSRSTLVFTTHNPSQAARLADEVLFIYHGKIVERGAPHSVFKKPGSLEVQTFLKNWRI